LFLEPQDEVGPSISSSIVLCSFGLLIYVILSVGQLLPFEDFTSVWMPLDTLPANRRMGLVMVLSPWCL